MAFCWYFSRHRLYIGILEKAWTAATTACERSGRLTEAAVAPRCIIPRAAAPV